MHQHNLPTPLRVHGLDLSYFTGKLEGYLRCKGIAYDLVEMSTGSFKACAKATGVAQMPQVEWHNGQWLSDTTQIIEFLEANTPGGSVIPADPLMRFVAQLLEDFGDEWLWRPALYYRWAFEQDARLMGSRLAQGMLRDVPAPMWVRRLAITNRQRWHFLWRDGYRPSNAAATEAVYKDTLAALQTVLAKQPYLLGDAPTVADFGLFGSMFRHFFSDPTPAGIMRRQAPAVQAWVARVWNTQPEDWANTQLPAEPSTLLGPLLAIVHKQFIPYMQANEKAWQAGSTRFQWVYAQGHFNLPVQAYRAWRYQRLHQRYHALPHRVAQQLEHIMPGLEQTLALPIGRPVPSAIAKLPIAPAAQHAFKGRAW